MKKLILLSALTLIIGCFGLTSCSVNPSQVSDGYAKDFVKKVKYIKDENTGLCYAIVATRETGSTDQNGISWTWVPCDSVQKVLIK